MTMKRILIAAALLASALPARGASTAEEAAALSAPAGTLLDAYVDLDLELSLELSFYSAYLWRGQILFDTAVWQPAGNLWLKLGEAGEYGRIKAHHYADTFAGKGKTLTLIGLAFSKERRTIVDAAIEELEM